MTRAGVVVWVLIVVGACGDDGVMVADGAPPVEVLELLPPGGVAPRGFLALSARGGQPPYVFAIREDRSGASVEGSSGVYRAGAVGDVADTVQVTDAAGDSATASVVVGQALSVGPEVLTVDPVTALTLAAAGGAPPYDCALAADASGATLTRNPVDEAACLYRAGVRQGEDLVSFIDANGVERSIRVLVGGAFSVAPTSLSVAPRETRVIGAFGGARDFEFMLTAAPSGGTVQTYSGVYRAGEVGDVVDVVHVIDGAGAAADVTITVTAALALAPDAATVAVGETVAFVAGGGLPPYAWTLVAPSGGVLAPAAENASYTAGTAGGVDDVVTVTDSTGATRTGTVYVLPGARFAVPELWAAPLEELDLALYDVTGAAAFTMAAAPSGGAVVATGADTARYTAGPSGGVDDIVQADGAWGFSVFATIHVGPALAISPLSATVTAGGTLSFTASGGKPPYAFDGAALPSGGSITAAGAYLAGATEATDTIRVTDAAGATAMTIVTVTATPPPPLELTPASAELAPSSTQDFTAAGGCGGYSFTLLAPGAGALAGLAPDQVRYTAPAVVADDTLRVTDACAASVDAAIHTGTVPTLAWLWPRGSAPGNAVTIVGSGFAPAAADNTVLFGATPAVVERAEPGSLVVRVPAHAPGPPETVAVSVATVDGAAATTLAFVVLSQPTPLPFVFSRRLTINNYDFFLADTHFTAAPRRLTDYSKYDLEPAVSPDGRWFAYSSDRDSGGGGGYKDVYLIDLDGVGGTVPVSQNLTATPSLSEGLPVFSPDGEWLYLVRGSAEIWRLRHLAPDPAATLELVDDGGASTTWTFLFSPDGGELVLASDRSGRDALYRLPLGAGGAPIPITAGVTADEITPHFSPAGDRLYLGLQDPMTFAVAIAWVDPQAMGATPTVLPAPPLPAGAGLPRVSWDGADLCLVAAGDLWLGDADGAAGAPFVEDRIANAARFTADGASLVFQAIGPVTGEWGVYRYDVAAASWVMLEELFSLVGVVAEVP